MSKCRLLLRSVASSITSSLSDCDQQQPTGEVENGQVTFAYRDHKTQEIKRLTLPAQEFIRRFLRHVLPKGFVKVRSYGLVSSTQKEKLEKARTLLTVAQPQVALCADLLPHRALDLAPRPPAAQLCPHCKIGHLVLLASLLPQRTRGP